MGRKKIVAADFLKLNYRYLLRRERKRDDSASNVCRYKQLNSIEHILLGTRCPAFRVKMLPKHRKKSDSCNSGSDKKDTFGSQQDQDSSSTAKDQISSSTTFNNPSAPTMYDCRKYGHNLPMDSVMPNFETLPCIPTGIFRCTAGEVLGNGANKGTLYQNPEYFSFHHMTFYDMHLILRCYRTQCPATGRKK